MPPGTAFGERSLPHGHVAAVLGAARAIGLGLCIGPSKRASPIPRAVGRATWSLAMIVSRIIAPASKLATARALDRPTAASSLGVELGLGEVDEDELYAALDGLLVHQGADRDGLAERHLKGGTLVLYDVSSSYVEGRCCELAKRGYNRDGKKGKLQIVYGLLCAADGCPVASRCSRAIPAIRRRWPLRSTSSKTTLRLDHVVLVGDRGMITEARIDEELRPAGLDWITALRAPALQGAGRRRTSADVAVRRTRYGGDQLARFSRRAADRLPQPRSRARARSKREDLLAATERDLAKIAAAVTRKTPARCAARPRSASPSAPCSTSTRWPSTSN